MRSTIRPALSRRQILVAGGAACVGAPALAGRAPLQIRLSHVVAEDTPKGLAAARFQALIGQRAEGRLRVEVYPSADLYGDFDEMEALHTGAVEMLAPSLSKFGRAGFPEFELFDLPYIFDDLNAVHRVTRGPFGQELLGGLQRQGLVGLGFLDNGFKHMSAIRPLHEVTDFQGLRMRVQSSRVIATQMRALGARPVPLPFSATRDALARGIVQGTENPLSNFWTQGMHEVQPHLALTRHGYLGYAVITSARFWSSLPAADQNLLSTAMNEALAYGNRIAGAQNDKALVALRDWGRTTIYTPTAAQRARMARAVESVYDDLGARIGARWVRGIRQAIQT